MSAPDMGDEGPQRPDRVVRAPVDGAAAVRRLLRPRRTRSQLIIGALCALLGFGVVTQVHQASEANLSGLTQDELVRILDEATDRADALSVEAADLQRERAELESGSDTREAALAAAERNAAAQGILTGRLPAVGPGVKIVVSDPDGQVRPLTLLNLLEELRNAGAEAVSVNDHRVVASSSFVGSAGEVVLDGQLLVAPYVWYAIGDPGTIVTALGIPGGADAAVRRDGGRSTVTKSDNLTITTVVDAAPPRYATPVPASTP
ncbi:MAG: DUF881 domain-containing protein [Actinobacteria bacterium]|nr:DUF881 domain-containing protein [Actinomycetota bacterium]MCG2801702.1 DUF881 domain-containing protein [Cellulomonas sp.]